MRGLQLFLAGLMLQIQIDWLLLPNRLGVDDGGWYLLLGGVVMSNRWRFGLLLALLLSVIASTALAQETKGSIRGTVYHDLNADGRCVNTGEPGLAGVPIKFASDSTTVYLESGDDGTYGLVAAGLGTWTVGAEPTTGSYVTSKNPIQVYLGVDERLVLGVDFCVITTGSVPPAVVLPESGATLAPALLIALATGLGFATTGIGLEIRRRRA
jgi:hypothetical protein